MSNLSTASLHAARCFLKRSPRFLRSLPRLSSSHAAAASSAPRSEIDRMRAFSMLESSRQALMDAEEVLLWWAYQRTPESVNRSLDILEQMMKSQVVDDVHSLRKMVNAIVINYQAVRKEQGQVTLSPMAMLERLDDIARNNPSFQLSGKALSILIDVAVQAKQPLLAEQLLQRILDQKSFAPSTHTLNTVLHGYSDVNKPFKIQELLQRFRTQRLPVDINSYNILLSCLANNQQADLAERYLEDLCSGAYQVTPTQWTFHAVLHALAGCQQPERAEAILARLYDPFDWGALGVRPDTTTINLVLACWAKSGRPEAGQRAWDWLQEQQAWAQAGMANVAPDVVSYGTVIHALCTSGQVEQAEDVVQNMYQQYISHTGGANSSALVPNVKLLTPILEGWSKSQAPDRLKRAEHFFAFLKDWAKYFLETPLDLTVYNVMMDVYGRTAATADDLRRADKLLQEMKQSTEFQPNFATYSMLIQLFLRHNKLVEAQELMDEVRQRYDDGDRSCWPDERSMNQLIRCFCRADAPEAATKLLGRMCEALFKKERATVVRPDLSSFGSVVAAYARSDLENAAEQAESVHSWLIDLHRRGLVSFGPDYMVQRARLACWSKSRAKNGWTRAYGVLQTMIKQHTPDVVDYNEVISALTRNWKPRRAEKLLDDIIAMGKVEPNIMSFNLVLLAWSRVGVSESLDRIEAILERMETLSRERGWPVEPDAVSYNNLLQCITCSTKIPDAAERAETVLQSMMASKKFSYLSFVLVVNRWLKEGKLDRAESVLRLLHDECKMGTFVAQRKHFQQVADACQAAGDNDRADAILELWQSLKQNRGRK